MADEKYRFLSPSSWTWIFVALLLCLTVMAMHNKAAKNSSMAFIQPAAFFRLISR